MRFPQQNMLPPASPACAAFADLLPLVAHDLLAPEDAKRLQEHLSTCAHCRAQLAAYDYLDALLRVQAHVYVSSAPTLEETMDHIEDQQNPLPPLSPAPRPVPIAARQHRVVTTVAALAAVLIIALLAQALLSHLPRAQQAGNSATPDATADYDANVSQNWLNENVFPPVSQYPTPQQAFVTNPARMCRYSTTLDQTETWLAATSTFGLVLIQAHCSDGRSPVAWVGLERTNSSPGGCDAWSFDTSAYFVSRPLPGENIPANARLQVPGWLALPTSQYENVSTSEDGQNEGRIRYGASIWLSANQLFAATRFAGEAVGSHNAVSVGVDGFPGWYVSERGMTTVTVPLDSRESFTFAGSGDPIDVLPLATAALAHLDQLQPRTYDPGHSTVLDCH